MSTIKNATGFYGTDSETYYVAPSGRIWIVSSDDTGSDPVEIQELPATATAVDDLLAPEECADHCRRVEAVSGETLVEG